MAIFKSDELDRFLKSHGITQEEFADAVKYYSLGTVKNGIRGKTKINWEQQRAYSSEAIKLAEKSRKSTDVLGSFDFRMNKDFAEVEYNDVVEWINTADTETTSKYRNNFDGVFRWIDKDATLFLIRCNGLETPESDLRAELLNFVQSFYSSVGAVQTALPVIQIFLDHEQSFEKAQTNYEKSNDYTCKVSDYRKSLVEWFSKLFYEDSDPEKGQLVYGHIRCVNDMDDMAWNLLIAYTLVRADDESGDKAKQIEDKLISLLKQTQ